MLKYWSLIFYQSLRSSTTHMDIATIKTNKNQINRCHYNIFKDTISPMWCKLCIRNKQIQRAPCIKRASRMSFFILFSAIFFDLQYIATTLFGKKMSPFALPRRLLVEKQKLVGLRKFPIDLLVLPSNLSIYVSFDQKKNPQLLRLLTESLQLKN